MFTGLVEDLGRILRCQRQSDSIVFELESKIIADAALKLGDSIAIDGVCLTVTSMSPGHFQVLAGAETLSRTTLGGLRVGSKVNLERAMAVGERLGGHIMQGHVDGVAKLISRRDKGANLELSFEPPRELMRYIIEKGSIAIDGISLTVNRLEGTSFSVALIPHTVEKTGLQGKSVGQTVNIEVDVIGKYVESLLKGYR